MKIDKLELKNFRAFKHFKCQFDTGVNVLVGLNGFGKTSILDAIAIGYGQFAGGFETSKDRGILNSDIRIAKHTIGAGELEAGDSLAVAGKYTMERQFPVEVQVTVHEEGDYQFPDSWSRSRNTLKGRTTQVKDLKAVAQDLQKSVQNNENVVLPLLSYYGTGRLWKEKRLTEKKSPTNQTNSRLDGYVDCLDPESTYSAFAKWLRVETIAEYERKMQIIEEHGLEGAVVHGSTIRGKLLKAITSAVNIVLAPSGWSNIRYSATTKEVIATHKDQGNVPVSYLSDGVRNMLGMVADIAYRAVRLNPHLAENAVNKTSGIVLIDEVDMHLHPQWQQLVLKNLTHAFPNIQFIVTTHSPLIISEMKPTQVHLIKQTEDAHYTTENPAQSYGLTSNDILNEVMRDPSTATQISRNSEVEDALEEIHQLISTKQYESASVKIEELEEQLQGETPELVSAKLSIDLADWE
ncbi:AAA family ATPase [Vibrio agarivorans]|uniref:AAA family ATPase n=1 Tax=Vibrio agarivorans TaxID=153622 RepID=A0ABT7Y636_9VIBR|nr:AAA family ATPase [Vibrio agarivorans]MDN2483523.1 AAA family ATPase [Vibrio agarivorans]